MEHVIRLSQASAGYRNFDMQHELLGGKEQPNNGVQIFRMQWSRTRQGLSIEEVTHGHLFPRPCDVLADLGTRISEAQRSGRVSQWLGYQAADLGPEDGETVYVRAASVDAVKLKLMRIFLLAQFAVAAGGIKKEIWSARPHCYSALHAFPSCMLGFGFRLPSTRT
jgi:hypothetical protein